MESLPSNSGSDWNARSAGWQHNEGATSQQSTQQFGQFSGAAQTADRLRSLRKVCMLDYGLHIVGMVATAGTLTVIALIINYLKRDDAAGTIYASHMNWMISTFWWWALWAALSMILVGVSFGLLWPVFLATCLWFLYRMIKGVLRLLDDLPMM